MPSQPHFSFQMRAAVIKEYAPRSVLSIQQKYRKSVGCKSHLTRIYIVLFYATIIKKSLSGDSLHGLSPLIFYMQFFKHGHRLITGIDKKLGLALWAMQQVPYQNRIIADFCPCLLSTNQATDKFTISKCYHFFTSGLKSKCCPYRQTSDFHRPSPR